MLLMKEMFKKYLIIRNLLFPCHGDDFHFVSKSYATFFIRISRRIKNEIYDETSIAICDITVVLVTFLEDIKQIVMKRIICHRYQTIL